MKTEKDFRGTEWMGRYRPLVRELARHANQSVRYMTEKHETAPGMCSCYQEWQVLEYIVEHPDGMDNMRQIADELGIAKSSLTKYTRNLCALGYVRRFRCADNKKNIILRATEEGEAFYVRRTRSVMLPLFEKFFRELDGVPQTYLDMMVNALSRHNERRSVPPELKLIPADEPRD